ncbi:endothelin-converting enzyme homolog isoform X2 [Lingula anatina]|uniref:Endothelin-converting enzyme homolog isoform X2 n=1 Tax=Lingula anatina TaxID=7574 RepID=A0A1S3K4M5_LINAN|nr:endothelin-converting enzyme homolog isoform X2 [Lingula anatina]XP_013417583.1 endothelin-converting enzyme homolog isoform X2 [Lingula anatina]XP_013417584.1 endothelin-converting enzyme homolog isoform X2 [Lingula anatina]XP_013417585.1 endothelin-converting enzyme homolog isoform X2 [Lingula anatina]|eukprot:XP_013417582.1 endothelin-converting enzyme homolog isoform X2 [Lingula anatina]
MSKSLDKIRNRLAAEGYKNIKDEDAEKVPIDSESGSEDEEEPLNEEKESKWSKTEKQLGALLVIAMAVIVVLIILVVLMHFQSIQQNVGCLTPSCVKASGSMLKDMNLTINPCDDFYEYTCGNWVKNRIIPPDKPKWTSFAEVYDKNSAFLKMVLSEPGNLLRGENSTAVKKAKDLLTSCMDTSAIEVAGATPLLKMIKDLGSWPLTSDPVSGNWSQSSWNFMDTLVKSHLEQGSPFFSMAVSTDDKNSSLNIVQFEQAGLTLGSREEYIRNTSEKFHKAYVQLGATTLKLLGSENETFNAEQMENLWKFETKIAKSFLPKENMTDPKSLYHKMTVGELMASMGNTIDLTVYMSRMFNTSISASESVLVSTPDYMKKMAEIVKQSDHAILASYMVWQTIQELLSSASLAFRQALLIINKVEKGVSSEPPRWKNCVSKVDSSVGFATGALFVEKKFSKEQKNQVETILKYIRDAFTDNLPKVSWMDKDTQAKALDKAQAVVQQIGYPEWITIPKELDKYYQNLTVTSSLFDNTLALRRFYKRKNLDKRGKPPDRYEWHMTPAVVNAYYTSVYNYIAFPAGILQSPFYDSEFPMAYSFGAAGMVMGHELTHAFDSSGRNYDKYGNMHQWWNNASIKAFKKRTKCMVDQYSQYTIRGHKVNGLTTLGENIADNGGIKMAYLAYQAWSRQHAREQGLVGLNATNNQLLFMGFGKIWCSYYTPEYAVQALITDEHGPPKYRVNGALSNLHEFSETFSCPLGSKMNPVHKCSVW